MLAPIHVKLASPNMDSGQVPTFEPQETIKLWFMISKVGSWLLHAKPFVRTYVESWVKLFCLTQLWTQVLSLTSKKSCNVRIIVNPKPKSPITTQWLRLHELTLSNLGVRSWDALWFGLYHGPGSSLLNNHTTYVMVSVRCYLVCFVNFSNFY